MRESHTIGILSAEETLRLVNEQYERQTAALVALTRNGILKATDENTALRHLTETAAHTLHVERTSIWRFNVSRSAIVCDDLFELSIARHSSGMELPVSAFPSYFGALADSDVIPAHDARNDPRTREFLDTYLAPLGITSMLDTPIIVDGKLAGVFCMEHVGPARRWAHPEQSFALSVANLVSLHLVQRARARSEEQYRTLAESSLTGVYLIQDGVFKYVNPVLAAIFGYEVEEIVNRLGPADLTAPDDRPVALENIRKRIDGEVNEVRYTFRGLRKDGSLIDVEVLGRSITYQGKPAIMGTLLEITERKRAEARIREREFWLRESQRIGRIGSYDLDVQRGVWTSSDVLDDIFGIEHVPEKTVATWNALVHPDERQEMLKYFNEHVIAQRNPFDREYRIHRADTGEERWVWGRGELICGEDGTPLHMIGTIQDVTERKRAEERIRFQAHLLDEVGEAVIATDLQGMITYWNRAAENLYGWPASEVLGRNVMDVTATDENREQAREILARLRTGESWAGEFLVRRKDGSTFRAQLTDSPVWNGRGELSGIIGVSSDISERKKAELELRRSEAWLSALFEASRDGVVVERDEVIVFANRAFAHLYGYETPGELIGRHISVVQSEHDSPRMLKYGRTRVSGGAAPSLYEFEGKRQDGTLVPMEVSASTFSVQDRHYIVSVVRDITDRKKAENSLKEADQKLRRIIEHSTNLFYTHTPDGTLTYVSPQSRQILDCEPEEALVRWTEFLTDNPINQRGIQLTDLAITTGTPQPPYELELRGKAGRIVWVEVREAPVVENGTTVAIVGSLRDITERKKAEAKLEMLGQTIRSISECVVITDLQDNIIFVNEAFQKTYGYEEHEILGKHIRVIRPSTDPVKPAPALSRMRAGGWHGELMNRRKNGEEFPIFLSTSVIRDDTGRPVALVGVSRDITEQKRAEEVLRLQSAALESAANGIVITDHAGKIIWVNTAFTHMTGYTKDEAVGNTPRILNSGKQSAAFYKNLWETITDGRVWHSEVINRRKDGSLYHEEMTITPLKDEHGTIRHFIAIKQDISERRTLEEQFYHAQRLESLGTLAGGIAHDFNNILGIIMGHASILHEGATQSAPHSIQAITTAAERGTALVKHLLTFARKTEQLLEPVLVNNVVEEIKRLMEETFPRTIVIRSELQAELPVILADSTQLHQVLLNLCVNARDAMPQGGTLLITTGSVSGESVRVRHAGADGNTYVLIQVSDTGTGMDAATRQRIFEPFFTTKETGKGTGLGLALVYSILQNHNGCIEVDTEPGHGTTFRVYLPAQERKAELPVSGGTSFAELPGGSETILLIEDEDMLAQLATAVLTSKGYTVITAANGQEGVEMFARHNGAIALVITDLGLPVLSGEEVVRQLRALKHNAAIMVASGFIDPDMKAELQSVGVRCFLQKPYKPAEMLREIRNVLDS